MNNFIDLENEEQEVAPLMTLEAFKHIFDGEFFKYNNLVNRNNFIR
jgi:hypothetical protein